MNPTSHGRSRTVCKPGKMPERSANPSSGVASFTDWPGLGQPGPKDRSVSTRGFQERHPRSKPQHDTPIPFCAPAAEVFFSHRRPYGSDRVASLLDTSDTISEILS